MLNHYITKNENGVEKVVRLITHTLGTRSYDYYAVTRGSTLCYYKPYPYLDDKLYIGNGHDYIGLSKSTYSGKSDYNVSSQPEALMMTCNFTYLKWSDTKFIFDVIGSKSSYQKPGFLVLIDQNYVTVIQTSDPYLVDSEIFKFNHNLSAGTNVDMKFYIFRFYTPTGVELYFHLYLNNEIHTAKKLDNTYNVSDFLTISRIKSSFCDTIYAELVYYDGQ